MGHRSLDIYAERARLIADPTVASGRRPVDRESMPAIRSAVIERLELGKDDVLLDIGSGFGELTVPLSYFCRFITAVDHPDVLARMPERPNIERIPGDFLKVDFGERRFTKILAYSMLHYLEPDEITAFVYKAIGLLADGGLLLIGDVPNDPYR